MPQTRKHDKRSRSGTPSTQNPDMVESVGVQSFKQKPIAKTININDKIFYIHPVYTNYASSDDGQLLNMKTKRLLMGTKMKDGSRRIVLNQSPLPKKNIAFHRFVFECFNGELPNDVVIVHINGIKDDNRIDNLQMESSMKVVKELAKNVNSRIDYDSELSEKEKIGIDKAYEKMMKKMKRKNIDPSFLIMSDLNK